MLSSGRKTKCKVCKAQFTPMRPMQMVCSFECATKVAENATKVAAKEAKKKQAAERKETKQKLEKFKKKGVYLAEAQKAFNAFIRARDLGKSCISCDTILTEEPNTYDAGHYRSVGSAPHMRFVEDNVHGQCKHCNHRLAGNHIEYRKKLLTRIGAVRLEAVECDNTPRHYTKDDLAEIEKTYKIKRKLLTSQK